jgi:Chemotaxis phosphatase CheX
MGAKRVAPAVINPHGVIDSIVQGSTVDLFEIYGVAVAPRARSKGTAGLRLSSEFVGTVRFSGKGGRGTLMLDVPSTVIAQMSVAPQLDLQTRDWIRELTNQLSGRIKNRLLRFQYELQLGLPSALERRLFEHRTQLSESATLYGFRTLRGEVQVIVEGTIDESTFAYSGEIAVPGEGDVIIF